MHMAEKVSSQYGGLLVIGDPHLEGRQPGFRKDDYPTVILEKFSWAINYAKSHSLLPIMLGDLFDKPRDNPTWMIGELIEMLLDVECIGIYGNHDCADPQLGDNDTFSLLLKSGGIRLVDVDDPWIGQMNGRAVVVGGSSYRQKIPSAYIHQVEDDEPEPFVTWITHHDLIVPGYEDQGRLNPREIRGINLVINGHIHRRLEDVQKGKTLWMTPGNISRRSRSDAVKDHIPSVVRIDVQSDSHQISFVEVPHEPFEDVFHDIVIGDADDGGPSAFIEGLAQLQSLRTESGAGLIEFLESNIDQFEDSVATEIMSLAKEVTTDG